MAVKHSIIIIRNAPDESCVMCVGRKRRSWHRFHDRWAQCFPLAPAVYHHLFAKRAVHAILLEALVEAFLRAICQSTRSCCSLLSLISMEAYPVAGWLLLASSRTKIHGAK